MKTKKILEKEQDRVEKVKKARENAVQIAMEKTAKLILKERRYESNTKRHAKLMADEESYRNDKFATIADQRKQRRQYTKDHDAKLDRLGIERYRRDQKEVEEHIELVQNKELKRARESYLNLQRSMEATERK